MIGSVIGNYRILEKLGEGGMGAVYRAIDLMLEREIAVKALHPELARRPDLVERFRAEAVTLARLNHQNIATLYGLHRQSDQLLMIMEFVKGESLESQIRRAGRMQPYDASSVCCQILDALDYAHRMGVVHRDIKPANLMILSSGAVKVMDFGIARVLGSRRQTREGTLVGTLAYMSPEQVRGQEVDGRSDLYSLGCVLYEMLTGRVPFESVSEYELMMQQIQQAPVPPVQIIPDTPVWLNDAILRAMAKDTVERFQSAAEFRTALQSGLASLPAPKIAATPPPTRVYVPETATHSVASGAHTSGSHATPAPTPASGGYPGPAPTRVATAAGTALPQPPAASNRGAFIFIAAALVVLGIAAAGWMMLRPTRPAPEAAVQLAQPQVEPVRQDPPPGALAPAAVQPTTPPSRPIERTFEPEPLPGQLSPPASPQGRSDRGADAPKAPQGRSKRNGEAPQKNPPPAEERPRDDSQREAVHEPPAKPPEAPKVAEASVEPPPVPVTPAEPKATRSAALPEVTHKVKALVSEGGKTKERDAILRLGPDRLVVIDDDSGKTLKRFAYPSISSAVYSQSKHPRWKSGIGAAAAVGVFAAPVFFMKGTKHWFTVQSGKDYIVLRLDKNNYRVILPEFETRAGVKVDMEKDEN